MSQPHTYEIVVRDSRGREYVARKGNAEDPRLRDDFERQVTWAMEDGAEVLGIRLNGLSALYSIDDVERLREDTIR